MANMMGRLTFPAGSILLCAFACAYDEMTIADTGGLPTYSEPTGTGGAAYSWTSTVTGGTTSTKASGGTVSSGGYSSTATRSSFSGGTSSSSSRTGSSSARCGDGLCSATESCSSCSTDCGVCKPDLEVTDFSLTRHSTASAFSVCLNLDLDGQKVDRGNYVTVSNMGTADSATYHVGIGLRNSSTRATYYAIDWLEKTSVHELGYTATWRGPYCVDIARSSLPAGTYRLVVTADIADEVDESDESNNSNYGSNDIVL